MPIARFLRQLATPVAFVSALLGGTVALAAPITVDFRDPGSLNGIITSQRLTTAVGHTPTPYYDSLGLAFADGLTLSISATAHKNGNSNQVLNDRVVYYSQVGAPGQAGLGVTSVTYHEGPLGTRYVTDNAGDGSIDIDSYHSADNGHDGLLFSFNRAVTLDMLSLFHFAYDDRAIFSVLAGKDAGNSLTLSNDCLWGCWDTEEFNSTLAWTGTKFFLKAGTSNGQNRISEFRLAGLGFTPAAAPPDDPGHDVPEPASLVLLGLGMLGLTAGRSRQATSK